MIKKWRPFWSYDIEKTERWLSWNAAEGKRLVGVNLLSRMFFFEDAGREDVHYQIVYGKTLGGWPRALGDSGWENSLVEGDWKFIKNGEIPIQTYPSREGILKRNRLHSNVLTVVALLSGMQSLFMMVLLSVIIFSDESFEGAGQLWWAFGMPIVQSLVVIFLAVYATIKLRAFERKFFDASVDAKIPAGKTFAKWRFGWMYAPDLIENWLSDMSAEGNHLVRVGKPGTRFIFEKEAPKLVSYVHDYQLKASPDYYDIHKSAGWQLKFTSPYSFTKYSIWQKEYGIGEEKPQFTYDVAERKAQVRKVVLTSAGLIIWELLFTVFILWMIFPIYQEEGWALLGKFLIGGLILSLFIPIPLMIRLLKYVKRMRSA